eukprot:12405643-Karenia_brevis.AAC.1
MENHDRSPSRRSPSHKASRNKKDPFSTSANSTPTMMPSLDPEGPIPRKRHIWEENRGRPDILGQSVES